MTHEYIAMSSTHDALKRSPYFFASARLFLLLEFCKTSHQNELAREKCPVSERCFKYSSGYRLLVDRVLSFYRAVAYVIVSG